MVLAATSSNWNATQNRRTSGNTKAIGNNDSGSTVEKRWREREREREKRRKQRNSEDTSTHRCREVTYFIKRSSNPDNPIEVRGERRKLRRRWIKTIVFVEAKRRAELPEHIVSDAIWWVEVLLLDKRHENELFSTVPCRASSAFNLSSLFCLSSRKPRDFSIPPTIPPITNDLLNVISHFCVLRYSTYLLPLYFPIHPSLFLRVNEFQYLFAVRTDSSLNLLSNTTGRTIRI